MQKFPGKLSEVQPPLCPGNLAIIQVCLGESNGLRKFTKIRP